MCSVVALAACSSNDSGGTVTDSGQGSGTDAETGGGTCSLATTCLGSFLGTCFDPAGTCTVSGPAGSSAVIYTNGAKMTKSGTTWTATNTKGVDCYTVDDNGGSFVFHVGADTLTMTTAGNQTRWTCPDGTPDNFTTAAFDNSECALYVPGAACK